MNLLTRQKLADEVCERWREQYKGSGYREKFKILRKLEAARREGTLSPDIADEIIGHGGWTRIICNECEASVDKAMELGEIPDYESDTAVICEPCLRLALQKLAST